MEMRQEGTQYREERERIERSEGEDREKTRVVTLEPQRKNKYTTKERAREREWGERKVRKRWERKQWLEKGRK